MGKSNTEAKTTDIAEVKEMPTNLAEVFGEQSIPEGIELRLPQIKIIHQGGAFEMADGDMLKSFEGVILDIVNVNAYWKEAFNESGGGTPPDCSSMDGISPSGLSEDIQNETCAGCKMNEFGTAQKGDGKACKNMKRVHIMLKDEAFPKRLTVPPTSRKAINEYGTSISDKGGHYIGALTGFSLKEASNSDGIKYSELVLSQNGWSVTSQEEFEAVKKVRKQFLPAMREQEITAEEAAS